MLLDIAPTGLKIAAVAPSCPAKDSRLGVLVIERIMSLFGRSRDARLARSARSECDSAELARA